MKRIAVYTKWKRNIIQLIGGLLIGAGITDCIIAVRTLDLNQAARGLTIFSAGLTIIVVLDSSKTQRETETKQKEIHQKLEQLEALLLEMKEAQQSSAARPKTKP